jgi:hypothetical protein
MAGWCKHLPSVIETSRTEVQSVIDYNSGTPAREAVPEENSPDHLSDPRLTATAKLILLYVHHHGDPGTAALAKALGVGRSSVAKARASLIETVGYKRVSKRDGGISSRDGRMALPSRFETVAPQKSRIETGVSRIETVESPESRIETVEPAPPLVPPSVPLPGPLPLTPPLSPPREDIVRDATRPVAGVSARGDNHQDDSHPDLPEAFREFGRKVRGGERLGCKLTAAMLWNAWRHDQDFRRAWEEIPPHFWETARVDIVTQDQSKIDRPLYYLTWLAKDSYKKALEKAQPKPSGPSAEGERRRLAEEKRLEAERKARDEALDKRLREESFAIQRRFEERRARLRETQSA